MANAKYELDNEAMAIARIVVDSEYSMSKTNQDVENAQFESIIDMLECKRNEKDYDWLSNYHDPQMNSIFHTEGAGWVSQYFPTRDFVEVKLDGETEDDKRKAMAAKKCVNKTLNRRNLYYYPKFVRLRGINSLFGRAYILARWEQATETETVFTVNDQGFEVPETRENILYDHFNFDVLDPRNVFTDNRYDYSVQDKDWITVRYESSMEKLRSMAGVNKYTNLDELEELLKNMQAAETETSKGSYNKDSDKGFIADTPVKPFDVIDRYGKFMAVVKERDKRDDYPTVAEPGIDAQGNVKPNAEMIETIITFALVGTHKIMIRFLPTPFIDGTGNPFKPIARSLCYVHPTKDDGISDGVHMRELQILDNDIVNMSMDRTKLATMPTFKGKKLSLEDNLGEVFFEPEHVIPVENMDDLQEIIIRDDISGSLQQLDVVRNSMYQAMSVYPPNMGGVPDKVSTTATAVAGAEANRNTRMNYKSLTFEYTFLQEFYWLILQMTWRFAKNDTAMSMMGEDAMFFDANLDYTYTPLSANIETEYNKAQKVKLYDQMIGRISGLAQVVPEVLPVIAYMTGQQIQLLVGEEDPALKKMIEQLSKAKPQPEAGGNGQQVPNMGDVPMSNQSGMPMSGMEVSARDGMMPPGGTIKV